MTRHEYTAVTYARTDHGDDPRCWQEVEDQQRDCRAAAKYLGIHVVAEFVDIGQRGGTAERPGLGELVTYAAQHHVDYAVVSSIDRLADKSAVMNELLFRLRQLGINVLMADYRTVIELVLPSDLEVLHGGDDEQS
ncbi:recombinase family protein [Mycobacteroides abscessus]|uniref:recombinase family protein n=1 Tax=Mycobacteroides abscessus TaxID=36809 RepID=UPI0009CA2521|nr:recombinase family protein [Mycobacteroides abscessus]SKT87423.1 Resolvase, N terminal domain [Mycobacteroides abscessus subsp. massiliense]SKU07893.1 Resolvase, N terminal domain [Mycobacteroides abscessus subsp. massiliense]